MTRNKRRVRIGALAATGLFITALLVACAAMGGAGDEAAPDRIAAIRGSEGGEFEAASAVTNKINYQGRLTDSGGNPLSGTYTMTFKLYETETGGTALATDTHSVTVTNGLFNTTISLGIGTSYFDGRALWLGITVEADPEMTPRVELMPVPYALSLRPGAVINGSVGSVSGGRILYVRNNYKGLFYGDGIRVDVYGDNSAGINASTTGNNGKGVYASTSGSGSEGVYASTYGANSDGVYVVARGIESEGVYVETYGYYSPAVRGYSQKDIGLVGQGSTGVWGQGTSVGVYGKSAGYAGKFQGKVAISSYSTGSTVLELGEGLDYAEGFDVSDQEEIGPGSVLCIDPLNPGLLTVCDMPYDRKVAGIVTGAQGLGSGVRLGSDEFDYNVALAGRVYCNVDATESAVKPGDLLTTSATPGYAMKVTEYERAHGAILGKAMEPLEKGEKGQILVLVTLQ
ncbi:MAG: hypothetical protein EFT35_08365 [Methanophagales archaeon ANME-1-THS]|nr:MAG: hypothetical protein EFT35_08365 [Methanophagales archaeon ANME-1-THS]